MGFLSSFGTPIYSEVFGVPIFSQQKALVLADFTSLPPNTTSATFDFASQLPVNSRILGVNFYIVDAFAGPDGVAQLFPMITSLAYPTTGLTIAMDTLTGGTTKSPGTNDMCQWGGETLKFKMSGTNGLFTPLNLQTLTGGAITATVFYAPVSG